MNFGQALEALKEGKDARRKGWNGPDQFVTLIADFGGFVDLDKPEEPPIKCRPFFLIWTTQKEWATWVPSTSDILAEDWEVTK